MIVFVLFRRIFSWFLKITVLRDAFCLLRCYYSRQPKDFLNLKNLKFGLLRIFRLLKTLFFYNSSAHPWERLNGWTNNRHDNGSKHGITLTKKYWGLHYTRWAPQSLSLPWMIPGLSCSAGRRESCACWHASARTGLVTSACRLSTIQ